MDPKLSLIIVSLKDKKEIDSLQKIPGVQKNKCEIIIRSDKGICAARNAGIQEASTDKILFLDDDAIPCEGYIDRAIAALEKHDIVAGRVIDTGHPWVGNTVRHYDQGDQPKQTETVVGCNMGFRKEVFESIGLFDEAIQWGHDETELAARALSEYDIHYDPELAVRHPYAVDIPSYLKKQYRLGVADVYFWKKTEESIKQNVLKRSISPREYLDYTLTGTAVKIPGGLIKSYGRLQAYNRYRKGQPIFE